MQILQKTASSRLIASSIRSCVCMNFPPVQPNNDIEYAISQYVDGMNPALYQLLANGTPHYLLDHTTFEQDMRHAINQLDGML